MLPFLLKKQRPMAGVIIEKRTTMEPEEEPGEMDTEQILLSAAKDLIIGLQSQSAPRVAAAIRAMYDLLESEEEKMEEESEPHSYDSQKE